MSRRHRPTRRHPEDADSIATINTTPLVDVMLVLLIIFLITVPVALTAVPVALPLAENPIARASPQHITLSINVQGDVFWNQVPVVNPAALRLMLQNAAQEVPPPAIYLHGDRAVPYQHIGRVLHALQEAGLSKIAFVTLPD